MEEDNLLFSVCDCHSEALAVAVEVIDDSLMVEFSIWRWGFAKTGWKYRLRHIWRIIRHGTPYTDEVILSAAQTLTLADWIYHNILNVKRKDDIQF